MKLEDQLAAEAARPTDGWKFYEIRKQRIKSAIEKATKPLLVQREEMWKTIRELTSRAAHASEPPPSEPYKHEYAEHLPETDAAAHAGEPFRFDIRWTPTGNEIVGNPNGKYVEYATPSVDLAPEWVKERERNETPATDDTVELLDWAWTLLANAGGGDWTKESKDWQEAVSKWRDEYHKNLSERRRVIRQLHGVDLY